MFNRSLFSSQKVDWSTPDWLFDQLNSEFHFTLDCCADSSSHKVDNYFTFDQDALNQVWEGVVWCNPPYSRKVGLWVKKAYFSHCITVMLLPSRTDTLWFHEYILGHAEIRFIKGRLKFNCSSNSAPFPSMIVIFRGDSK